MLHSSLIISALASKKTLRTRGTTLIEMLLYLGIVSVLLVGVGAVSMSALDARSKTRAVSAVYSGSTTAFAGIRNALEQNAVIRTPLFGMSSSTLVLASSDTSTTTTEVFLVGEQLFLRETSGVLFALTPSDVRVTLASFSALGAAGTTSSITVSLSIAASSSSMWQSYRYEETFAGTYVLGTYR